MKILVIGGSRFSGKIVVEMLAEKGHDVTVLNRGKAEGDVGVPFLKNERYSYPSKVKVIHTDRTNYEELQTKLEGNDFQAIIDTCAYNEKDIQVMMDLASDKLENYIFTSTGSVYDEENIEMIPVVEDDPFGSEADDCPVQYSRDKRRAETLLKKAFVENNFPYTAIRPTYIYGPNNYIYREAYFYDRIMDSKPIYMPGTGEYVIDFVFAADVAKLLVAPLENKKAFGQAYNAAGQGGITLNNYSKFLFQIIGKETEIIHFDLQPVIDAELKPENRNQMFPFVHDAHFVLSKEKAAIELGYKPKKLFDGLQETFEWYKVNRNPEWKGDYGLDEKIIELLKKQSKQ